MANLRGLMAGARTKPTALSTGAQNEAPLAAGTWWASMVTAITKGLNAMQTGTPSLACGACQDSTSWRSERESVKDHLLSWLGWYPWECRKCRTRYYSRRRG